jgi:hypothetical protein
MNCADYERLIALDVEGDLPQPQGRAAAEHLLSCPSCQKFEDSLKTSQALLKELGQEPLGEETLTEVRRRVRIGLAGAMQPEGLPVWRLALGVGVVAALIFTVVTLHHSSPGVKTRIVAERSTPASVAPPAHATINETPNSKIASRSAKSAPAARDLSNTAGRASKPGPISQAPPRVRSLKRPQGVPPSRFPSGALRANAEIQHPQPLTIKLLTDNPNVVIYWLID